MPDASANMSFFHLFWQAHIIVKFVMIGLAGASVWSWAIIIDKTLLFRPRCANGSALLKVQRVL
jgi:biopolymer transport protein ExbB/TolQ